MPLHARYRHDDEEGSSSEEESEEYASGSEEASGSYEEEEDGSHSGSYVDEGKEHSSQTSDGAAFVVRTSKKEIMIPLPIVGHWLKKGWGWYYKQSKMKRMFRIPGM